MSKRSWARAISRGAVDSRGDVVAPRFHAARYLRQRRIGFANLRFVPSLEQEYRDVVAIALRTKLWLSHGMGIVAIVGFLIFDRLFGDQMLPSEAHGLLGIALVALIAPLVIVRQTERSDLLAKFEPMALLVASLALVGVVWLCRTVAADFPYASLMLLYFYLYVIAPLTLRQAVAIGLAGYLLHVGLSGFALDSVPRYFPHELYYLTVTHLVGIVGHYFVEHESRTRFLLQREAAYYAEHDPLTGVLNRRVFMAHAQRVWSQAVREKASVGVLLLDLDHFKQVNDVHGHLAGDAALRAVAAALQRVTRRPLDAAGRFGGDEFIALWYGIDAAGLAALEQHLISDLSAFRSTAAPRIFGIPISGGAALVWPDSRHALDDAIRQADANMYRVKDQRSRDILVTTIPSASAA